VSFSGWWQILRQSPRIANTFTAGSFLNDENFGRLGRDGEVTPMKSPLVMLLVAVVLVTVGTLAVMNQACKSSEHAWCAPMSTLRHHIKTSS
jgi:hypothetical protein